jgi:microcystin-dependent protein
MSSPFVAEIRPWALKCAPRGWVMCQGQILPISQYTAVFALIGTYYGGNGTSNFQLPDLRSRVPMKYGTDTTGNQYVLGQDAGEETVQLLSGQMPIHTHNVFGSTASTGNFAAPAAGTALASNDKGNAFYAPGNSTAIAINPGTVSTYLGGNQAHTNLQPYLAINWCIALVGIFPSRN